MYHAVTCKGRFKQLLALYTNFSRYHEHLYKYRIFRTDWSEDELYGIYHLWQTVEERRRQIIMCLMCC
jgi:hypothetical protein